MGEQNVLTDVYLVGTLIEWWDRGHSRRNNTMLLFKNNIYSLVYSMIFKPDSNFRYSVSTMMKVKKLCQFSKIVTIFQNYVLYWFMHW